MRAPGTRTTREPCRWRLFMKQTSS
jgi:hypothetical protein